MAPEDQFSGRWPPIYDEDDLRRTIKALASADNLSQVLYQSPREDEPSVCQGDVLHLPTRVPVIHEDGKPMLLAQESHWIVAGNTCDFERNVDEEPWTQIVPVEQRALADQTARGAAIAMRKYQTARYFYVPPWEAKVDDKLSCANFTRMVTIHKDALNHASLIARLSHKGWLLFHSCLIRFLARDDGRRDPD